MTSVYVTSPSGACHSYLDMEVSAVDTHARVLHGRVSYIQYDHTELYNEVFQCILVERLCISILQYGGKRITSLHNSHFRALQRIVFSKRCRKMFSILHFAKR